MVKKIYQLLRELELQGPPWSLKAMDEIKEGLEGLSKEPDLSLQKISDLKKHLTLKMSSKTLQNIMVPIERYLQKSVVETDFLILDQDQKNKSRQTYPMVFVLENLRSSFNVGSFFRSCDALGVSELILTGYTSTPEQMAVQKTSLGSDTTVPWKHYVTTESAIAELKSKGFFIIAVETATTALNISEKFNKQPTAFVFGNERFGLNSETIKSCDEIRKISLLGTKNSLNVAVCAGIIAYEWGQQWNQK